MTAPVTAPLARSQRPMAEATRMRLWDVLIWVTTCAPVAARPFFERSDLRALDALAALGALGLLLVRRRWPVRVLATGLVAVVGVTAVLQRPTALMPVTVFLLYNVAVTTDRRTAIRAGIGGLASLLACVAILASARILGPELLAGLAWPALAVAAGDAVRSRREAIAAAEERAARAEATREEEARRRVVEERLHIARELHDVVAHQIAVINVQAGVAAHLLTDEPEQATVALGTIRTSARQVLDELAGILSVLRTSDDPATGVAGPVPTLHELPALIESFQRSGLTISFETVGAAASISDATAIAVYRATQEGLTNAHRYGDGAARVRLVHRPDALELEITNRIGLPSIESSGFGLVGMRERVLAAGGTLATGPRPDGSFVVLARFPTSRLEQNT